MIDEHLYMDQVEDCEEDIKEVIEEIRLPYGYVIKTYPGSEVNKYNVYTKMFKILMEIREHIDISEYLRERKISIE